MTSPVRIPTSFREIDPPWLESVLAKEFSEVRIERVEIVGHAEVTNAHTRLRIHYVESGGAPEHLFCKLLPTDSPRREAIARTKMGIREALFYARLAPGLRMRVPRAYLALEDEHELSFVMLLEDLVEVGCTVSDGTRGVAIDSAARALEDLAALHVRFADPARRRSEAPWVPTPDPPSDYGVVRLREGLDRHRDRLSDAFAEMAELYIAHQQALHDVWHRGPQTVIHGDAHIGNLFDDHGRTGFLDWGLIVISNPLRDMSYLINLALSIEDRRAHERKLIEHYLEVSAALGGPSISFEEAYETHRLQASYLAPACSQIVTFPEDATPARRVFADAFLARAEAAIEDLEARDALRQHAGL